ncbi:MAG: hypothetical protein J6P62_00085 [Bacteroidales bacterium]|nr:hypothetical protein [Bacteroidales bacterium]
MKYLRIILWAALTLVASAAFAQNEANRKRLSEIEKMEVTAKKGGPKFDRFGIRLLPEIGYGAHLVRSEDFRSQGLDSGQAYLQALDVFYRPFVWGSVHIGAGIGMDWFKIRDLLFVQDDEHNVMVAPFPEEVKDKDSKYRSSVTKWTVTVPATLQFHFGKATLRLGAEAQYSFAPKVRLDITKEDFREFTESKGARIQPFGYDFLAAVSFGHFGVYGKFQPASARRFPEPGPTFSTWTVGICLTTF